MDQFREAGVGLRSGTSGDLPNRSFGAFTAGAAVILSGTRAYGALSDWLASPAPKGRYNGLPLLASRFLLNPLSSTSVTDDGYRPSSPRNPSPSAPPKPRTVETGTLIDLQYGIRAGATHPGRRTLQVGETKRIP